MRVDLRVKHDIEARKAAIGLFERGHGFESAAKALSVPRNTVRQWLYVYRSFGSEVLLSMDGKQTRYTYEQKVAAASAVVDGGMGKQDAMKAFGVMSLAPLKRWCALYREGGAEALRPKPELCPRFLFCGPRTASLGACLTAPSRPRGQKRANMSTVTFLVTAKTAQTTSLRPRYAFKLIKNAR